MIEEKQLLLDDVKERIEEADGFIVTRYEGFDGSSIREFRDQIAGVNGEFEVVKKRVFVKAANENGLKFDLKDLKGHLGLIFVKEDLLTVLKTAVKHGKEKIQVLGGEVEGCVCSGEEMIEMSKLPSLSELRAQFVGLLEAPMAQSSAVIHSLLVGLVSCVEQKSKKEN